MCIYVCTGRERERDYLKDTRLGMIEVEVEREAERERERLPESHKAGYEAGLEAAGQILHGDEEDGGNPVQLPVSAHSVCNHVQNPEIPRVENSAGFRYFGQILIRCLRSLLETIIQALNSNKKIFKCIDQNYNTVIPKTLDQFLRS